MDDPEPVQMRASHFDEPESPRSQFAGGIKWVGWWYGYMDQVCTLLNQIPRGLVAQTPLLLHDVRSVISAGFCEICKGNGYEDLVEFSVLLSGKIDEVVSQVPFHIEY